MTARLSSLLNGLVLDMDLDQQSYNPATKRFTDRSAWANHGTSANAASFGSDRMGQNDRAMDFNGTSDYVDCGHDESLDIVVQITISIWFKVNYMGRYLLSKNNLTAFDAQYSIYLSGAGNKAVFYPTHDLETPVDSIQTGIWQNIVLTRDGSGVGRFYVDNVPSGARMIYPVSRPTFDLNIGRRHPDHWHHGGSIANVRIYNRALTSVERTLLYESYRPRLVV